MRGRITIFINDRIDCFGEFGAIKCSVLYLSCCVLKIQSFNSKQTKHISKLSASQIFNSSNCVGVTYFARVVHNDDGQLILGAFFKF